MTTPRNANPIPDSPMATVTAVLASYDLENGDIIHVDTGTYNVTRNIQMNASDSGVTIAGPPGNTAVFDRGGIYAGLIFELQGIDDVTFDHLTLTDSYTAIWSDYNNNGLWLEDAGPYVATQ